MLLMGKRERNIPYIIDNRHSNLGYRALADIRHTVAFLLGWQYNQTIGSIIPIPQYPKNRFPE